MVLTLANVCCATGDYPLALVHLQQLVDASGADLVPAPPPPAGTPLSAGWQLLSMLGRLQLQVGNLDGAEDAFSRLECLVMDADDCAVVRLNRGLLGVAQGAFDVAAAEFETVLQLEPGNAVAANNRAVCHLYACKLQDAIKCAAPRAAPPQLHAKPPPKPSRPPAFPGPGPPRRAAQVARELPQGGPQGAHAPVARRKPRRALPDDRRRHRVEAGARENRRRMGPRRL